MKITISGPPGSGKSTIAKMLAEELGFEHRSSGDFMRQMAQEREVSLAKLGEEAEKNHEIDLEIDKRQKEFGGKNDNFVIDGRIAFHFIPDSIKIFLDVEQKTGAERILSAKRNGVEAYKRMKDVIEGIKKREESETKRYRKYYQIDYKDEKNYDLVIDTTKLLPEPILEKIRDFIKQKL